MPYVYATEYVHIYAEETFQLKPISGRTVEKKGETLRYCYWSPLTRIKWEKRNEIKQRHSSVSRMKTAFIVDSQNWSRRTKTKQKKIEMFGLCAPVVPGCTVRALLDYVWQTIRTSPCRRLQEQTPDKLPSRSESGARQSLSVVVEEKQTNFNCAIFTRCCIDVAKPFTCAY